MVLLYNYHLSRIKKLYKRYQNLNPEKIKRDYFLCLNNASSFITALKREERDTRYASDVINGALESPGKGLSLLILDAFDELLQ